MGALDDATGELLEGAHFGAQECAAGYLAVLKAIAATKGLWTWPRQNPPKADIIADPLA